MPFTRNVVRHDHALITPGYHDTAAKLYQHLNLDPAMEVTFQVTENCNLACSYCYQINKSPKRMSFDIAKRGVDLMLEDTDYINSRNRVAGILDFIGGEPLLEIDLMREIYEYFLKRTHELNHPWELRHRVSFCSNGILFMDDKVQAFIKKYLPTTSIAITIDGPEELHDACRRFPDGRPSHAIVESAVKYAVQEYGFNNTKITLSPENISHIGSLFRYIYEDLHITQIFANCTFEGPWTTEHAKIFYDKLIELSDYCYENDTYSKLAITLFNEDDFVQNNYAETDENWCGGNGAMLAIGPDGLCYPCLRYMPSSLGTSVPPIVIGNVFDGLLTKPCEKCMEQKLKAMTATSQSTEECINCPIASGCAWCSGYNYQLYGELNKRCTEICVMHKTRALANAYYWNRFYEKHHVNNVFENYLPDDEAIRIIGTEAYDKLIEVIETQRKRVESR